MTGKLKLGFVVQRYGLEIAGGAEYHCRLIAELLRDHAELGHRLADRGRRLGQREVDRVAEGFLLAIDDVGAELLLEREDADFLLGARRRARCTMRVSRSSPAARASRKEPPLELMTSSTTQASLTNLRFRVTGARRSPP